MAHVTVIVLALCMALVHQTDGQMFGPQQEMCVTMTPDMEACQRSFIGKPISDTAVQVHRLQRTMWDMVPDSNITVQDLAPVQKVINNIFAVSGVKDVYMFRKAGLPLTPPSGYRVRSEYRALSDVQRRRFHNAMNVLYRDGIIAAFARIHAVGFDPQHNGASFLAWHRILLVVFEELLRKVDPTVSIPYLDTSIDDAMDNPVNSVVWTADYLGNGVGAVVTGPFAGWVTDQGPLERNIGANSILFQARDLQNVLTRCLLEEISIPTAQPMFDFETFHGGPHVWIGGDMSSPRTTAYDPAFYLHHTFVDYIWELFRKRQRKLCNVNPVTDYPASANGTHAFGTTMFALSPFINGDGLADYWTQNFYGYSLSPSCPVCSPASTGRPAIFCDRSRGICVATSRITIPTNMPLTRQTMMAFNSEMVEEMQQRRQNMVPRNRGVEFNGPDGDGRTQETFMMDAMNSAMGNRSGTSRKRSKAIHVFPPMIKKTPRTIFPPLIKRFKMALV